MYCGSTAIPAGTQLELTCSRGLQLAAASSPTAFATRLQVPLPGGQPFTTVGVTLLALAELTNQKDATGRQYLVSIVAPWHRKEQDEGDVVDGTRSGLDVTLHFVPAFYTTFNLLTVMERKFLQLTVSVLCDAASSCGSDGENSCHTAVGGGGFRLSNAILELANADQCPALSLVSLSEGDLQLFVSRQYEGSYIWQLEDKGDNNKEVIASSLSMTSPPSPAVKLNFSLDYQPDNGVTTKEVERNREEEEEKKRHYAASFHCQDYRTLFTVQARVEPAKGKATKCFFEVLF